jgi:hypothetical protein
VTYMADASKGKVLGCVAHGPASLHERNPGLFHYGIHAVEILYTIMGPGCEYVTCMTDKTVDQVTGHWKDGRIASIRGTRAGSGDYGALVFAEKHTKHVAIGTKYIYRELLKAIVATYAKDGKPPIDINTTLEIVSFIEAGLKSSNNHGTPQKLEF